MYSMKRYCLSQRRNAEIAEHAESFSKMYPQLVRGEGFAGPAEILHHDVTE
jgi:hypothetical protein